MTTKSSRVRLICGPTASGKTAQALNWAREHGGGVLNADSMQHYADLPILTARPTPDEIKTVPHHLYGHLGPQARFSTGAWLRAAWPVIKTALDGGPPVAVVGGTGLYFLSLTRGLAETPAVPPESLAEAMALYDGEGESVFRLRLKAVDPEACARIAPNDRQRLVRAWSVWLLSGRSLTDWQGDTRPLLGPDDYELEVLLPDRDRLYAACDLRLEAMMRDGALTEVAELMGRGLAPDWPIITVLGLRQAVAYIKSELSFETMLAEAKLVTRHYAKRQMTWFRNQIKIL